MASDVGVIFGILATILSNAAVIAYFMGGIKERVQSQANRTDRLEARVDTHDATFTEVRSEISAVSSKVANLEGRAQLT